MAAKRFRRKASDTTRWKMSVAHKGKRRGAMPEEVKKKISKSMKEYWQTINDFSDSLW